MTLKEVDRIFLLIKDNYPSWKPSKNGMEDWEAHLLQYDYDEVYEKLKAHMSNENYYREEPKLYYIINNLTKVADVGKTHNEVMIRCQLCNEILKFGNYDEHMYKCNSAEYIITNSLKYDNRIINRKALMELDNDEFWSKYWEFCRQLLPRVATDLERQYLENHLRVHDGLEPKMFNNRKTTEELITKIKEGESYGL